MADLKNNNFQIADKTFEFNFNSGFEIDSKIENKPEIAPSWEELPPGGDYIKSDPLQYTGVGIGTWVERDDESWEKLPE